MSDIILYDMIRWYDIVWYEYDIISYAMILYEMVCHDMIRYDTIWKPSIPALFRRKRCRGECVIQGITVDSSGHLIFVPPKYGCLKRNEEHPLGALLSTLSGIFCLWYASCQARREAGKGDVEDEAKARSAKLNNSIDNLKDCTTQVLAQVAALAKVWSFFRLRVKQGVRLYCLFVI